MKTPRSKPPGLESLDLAGLGRFHPSRKATFTVETLNLPAPWEYIFENGDIVVRVDQHGPISAQADPPKDIVLFRRESFQRFSSWLVWLLSPRFEHGAFTNFFRPRTPEPDPAAVPDDLEITFEPAKATWTIEHEGLRSITEISIPSRGTAVSLRLSLTNLREGPLELTAIPVLRPYANPAMLAPWDRPEWYLKNAFCLEEKPGFWTHLLNMNSEFEKRRLVVLWSDPEGLTGAEISHEKFAGQGGFENPEAVVRGGLRLSPEDGAPWGEYRETNSLYGYPPVHALQYEFSIGPSETVTLHQVLAMVPTGPSGSLPDLETAARWWRLLEDGAIDAEQAMNRERYERLAGTRTIETPDPCLNRYANEWLPLQLGWVASLDRGWPTGMRGARDAANDFAALVPLDPARCRPVIETMLSCQRTDGWFPRQFSAWGRKGKHDLREYVDAGCVILEFLHEYLCFTKDLPLLDLRLPWLDSDEESSVLDHALRALDYYVDDDNLGEHGLCKIREGDWLDAVNRAGLEARGESVTVTNQVIIALTQMSRLLRYLGEKGKIPARELGTRLLGYAARRDDLRLNLRDHAFNREGYFSSVFNDDGAWLFSDRDPDGVRRVYGPANWFSIISGVAVPDLVPSILKELETLRSDYGYRLFRPPMGETPIPRVGRIGTGDVPPGLNENATPYNHGAHGFLARALAVAGKGDLLYEVLRFMLPYDQSKHPVEKTLTPPYAVVNTWNDVPLFHGRGGMTFLTGSIAYATRTVYGWLCGIKPMLSGLTVDPCIPSSFPTLSARFQYLDSEVELEIRNPDGRESGVRSMVLNGKPIEEVVVDPFSGRESLVASDELFDRPKNKVVVNL